MRQTIREFIVVLLLGFFIGLTVGYNFGGREAVTFYTKEVDRLQNWNNTLLISILPKK